jgi:hypothetical protein
MLYSEILEEIITRVDRSFVEESEARAKVFFRNALEELIRAGDYSDEDILQYRQRYIYKCPDSFSQLEFGDIVPSGSASKISRIERLELNTRGEAGQTLRKVSREERQQLAFGGSNYSGTVAYWQVGRTLYFLNGRELEDKELIVIALLKLPTSWSDDDELEDAFSYYFIMRAIELAASKLGKELL